MGIFLGCKTPVIEKGGLASKKGSTLRWRSSLEQQFSE